MTESAGGPSSKLDWRAPGTRTFLHLLGNTLLVSVTNFTVWFAITFYVYLQARSVFATAIIAGIFLVMTAGTGIWFGSLVDHHNKLTMMLGSGVVSFGFYLVCFVIYRSVSEETFKDPGSVTLWVFVTLLMVGVIVGNIRTIALPTMVTALIPADRRDRANGLVGTASGVSFLVTSVVSGVLVAAGGLFYVLLLAMGVLLLTSLHLWWTEVPAAEVPAGDEEPEPRRVDLRGTIAVIRSVPGLLALIFFSTFNNFLGGVLMALMDAYGLSLVSVEVWGFLWGLLSTGFIIGGLLIARIGLGSNPVRTLLVVNLVLWTVTGLFTIQSSLVLLTIGLFIYMLLAPFAEASEQTVLQKVVPYHRQGRVFGFAQSVEQAASPFTAFLIGPIAQFVFIPFMTTGAGVDLIGGWFGTGPDRGMALVFTVTGILGLAVTAIALTTRYYRDLSDRYQHRGVTPAPPAPSA